MSPTGHFDDRARLVSPRRVKRFEAAIAVGLEHAGKARQVSRRVGAAAIGAVKVNRGGRGFASKRPVVADIDPQSPGLGAAQTGLQHRHRGVVGVDLLRGKHMLADRIDQRIEQPGRLSHPVGQGRTVEIDTGAGIDLALPIKR